MAVPPVSPPGEPSRGFGEVLGTVRWSAWLLTLLGPECGRIGTPTAGFAAVRRHIAAASWQARWVMGLAHDDGWAIPFDAPFYPPLPAWYRNVLFQEVFFRAAPAQVARLLPEPLESSPDGACVAIGLHVPFSTAYGAFNEVIYQEKAQFRGQTGWFCSHLLHDGPRGIAAGREIYGTPKIFAELEVRLLESTMLTRGAVAGVPVVTISSTMERPIAPSELPVLAPSWRLKLIPRADGRGLAIKQLIDGSTATNDLEVHAAFRGRGTVHLEPSPLADLTGLRPLAYGDAFSFEASYSEGFATIAYDYLVET